MPRAIGIIPARYGSTRLPGKPLVLLGGKPLIYWVWKQAGRAKSLTEVLVATDDSRVKRAVEEFGGKAVLTSVSFASGSDRVAAVARNLNYDIVVNIQGDEPLIDFSAIDQVVSLLKADEDAEMATLMSPITDLQELLNPNVVKVVTDQRGYAVYFSRAPLPYPRVKGLPHLGLHELIEQRPELLKHFYRHVGMYAYRSDFLKSFAKWGPSRLELLEDLEQLRAIEHGAKIKVGESRAITLGIDTPEDLERIRSLVGNNPKLLEV